LHPKHEKRKSKHAKLLESRIGFLYGIFPAFSGNRESEIAINYAIIKTLALGQPSYTWEITHKIRKDSLLQALELEPHYTTVDRHLTDLASLGLLEELASPPAKIGEKTIFGLTVKGVTVAESFPEVRANIVDYLKWRESFDPSELGPIRNMGDRTIRLIRELITRYPQGKEMGEQFMYGVAREVLNRRDFEKLSDIEVEELREESIISQAIKKEKLSNGKWEKSTQIVGELLKVDPEWRETGKKWLARRQERAKLLGDMERQVSSAISE
jgi:hypothetical protein